MKAKTILITGASSGFGKETARKLAQQGHHVYGTSRKPATLEGVQMLVVDVTQRPSIHAAVERIMADHKHLDVVINNAGMGISGALELATDREISQQMETNFHGVVNVCATVLPILRKQREGRIINLSSIAGVAAVPYQGFYSASKFAIEGYSEALALEVYRFGIKICLVEPGDFHTNFTANRCISEATKRDADYGKSFCKTMQLIDEAEQKGCKPEKLAKAICRLVNAPHPRFRTVVGPIEQVFFARITPFLPTCLQQRLLRMFYKL
ncbi:MAG: SDR family oxidoreductase [Bacteroidaceae bacterium]